MNPRILIIDDDEKLTRLLTDYLGGFGFTVASSPHPEKGLEKLRADGADLLILDVMLPGMNGFDVCREVRKENYIPIIMLTAKGELTDRVIGLELGADDYLPKPFEPRELVARIQSVLRRTGREKTPSGERMVFGELVIDTNRRTATLKGNELDLTSTEFELLALLAQRRGTVLDREAIMEGLRGIEWDAFNRSIDIAISRLRQKMDDHPKHPTWIKTVWGAGYVFIGEETPTP